jgi:tetratricopeptide (TPR) repeat protein
VYYEAAACLNDLNGFNNLGVIKQAMGDAEGGAENIRMAAAGGHQSAIFNVAIDNISKGRSADAISPLRDLARQNVIAAQYHLARILILGSAKYDAQEAIETLAMAIERGPWLTLCQTAEELWKEGRHRAAVLLWIDLADAGIKVAAFNAGLALLEFDPRLIGSEDDGLRVATTMFKSLVKHEDVSAHLAKLYRRRNKTDKAVHKLLHLASAARGYYSIAEASLDGQIEFRIRPLFANLSRALTDDPKFLLSEMLLVPKILRMVVHRATRCIQGRCDEAELEDFWGALMTVWKNHTNGIVTLLTLVCTVILLRRRTAVLYDL